MTRRVVNATYCGRFAATYPPLFLVPATDEQECISFVTVAWHSFLNAPPMARGERYAVETDGEKVYPHTEQHQ